MIKVAFFDFDDTLIIHRRRHMGKPDSPERMIKILRGESVLDNSFVPSRMVNFVEDLYNKGVQLFCLTYEENSAPRNMKMSLLETEYDENFSDVIVTSRNAAKIEFMKLFAEAHGLQLSEILFVDDKINNIKDALFDGFVAVSSVEILSSSTEDIHNMLGEFGLIEREVK